MKAAVVTGAARGIGAATVLALARDGWSVLAVDRCSDDPRLGYPLASEQELDRVVLEASALAAEHAKVLKQVGDVALPAVIGRAVDQAESAFGGLDAFVAAAGVIAGGRPQWELDRTEEDAVLEINLRAVLDAARISIPALLRRPPPREGRFVAVASAAATRGLPMLAAYGAAKAGVVGLVRALASELGGTGITANAVSPGATSTPILAESARLYGLDSAEAFAAQQPIGRLVRPEEVASAIVYLMSEAAGAVTGTNLAVDGGLAV
jgi:SDR family mycofactocin-dependent oxidoreductase